MKYLLIFILLICINCGSKTAEQSKFLGNWEYGNVNNENQLYNVTFSINLKPYKDSIVGNYCSVTRGGNRIDCFDEKTKNVRGKVLKDTLYVNFFSSFDRAKGNAKLFFKNKKLIWSVGNFEGESLATDIPLERSK